MKKVAANAAEAVALIVEEGRESDGEVGSACNF